jgi:hypothetical protein
MPVLLIEAAACGSGAAAQIFWLNNSASDRGDKLDAHSIHDDSGTDNTDHGSNTLARVEPH